MSRYKTSASFEAAVGIVQAGRMLRTPLEQSISQPVNSFAAFLVLDYLAFRDETIPQPDVRAVTMSKANTSEVTNTLADKGLIRKESHPTNGRMSVVRITDEGLSALEVTAAEVDRASIDALKKMDPIAVQKLGQIAGTVLEQSGQDFWLPSTALRAA